MEVFQGQPQRRPTKEPLFQTGQAIRKEPNTTFVRANLVLRKTHVSQFHQVKRQRAATYLRLPHKHLKRQRARQVCEAEEAQAWKEDARQG